MDLEHIKNSIRNIPDFPNPGIQFKDISTLLMAPEIFNECIEIFYKQYKNKGIDIVVGIESRGFIFAAPLALKLNCSLALARKPGKLPAEKVSETYDLEYGTDSLEIHLDAIQKESKVLIMDDLLATGGTASAANNLVSKLGGKVEALAFLIILTELDGKKRLGGREIYSIMEL
ncbi:MAG: adenine phosphoribosyltransferase [Candidatus Marinimicrobia bacterium]|nr:adenine phosphoribosyltransferase [Candidatus Neomarinimicrobiota bacterium]|tara:strand:- start:30807 stop:31328 length:522 start_codon:yes stop_codon:yes gene_type:complete